ncbi:Phosphotransferase enzyme [Microsporum audouinii]
MVGNTAIAPTLSTRRYSDSPEFYRYTSGRWLFNEAQQLGARQVQFNIDALVAVAARCLNKRPESCIKFEKLAEGDFNKSFLLNMSDGSQVIARVPNPNSGMPHFTTASEVATMDFARNVLDIPVPKVLTWNSNASKSPVGAEYIVMEKAAGTSLKEIWPRLTSEEKTDIVLAIVNFDVKLLNNPLQGIGSLYYPEDIPTGTKHLPAFENGRWVLGPITDRRFFDDLKGELLLDRGPWKTTKEYIVAVCHREMKAIQNPRRPIRPEGIVGPGGYKPDHALKLSVCHDFLKVAEYIMPAESCQVPVLWHNDLHLDNIFVAPERPTEIVGLIDWQNTHVTPLFDQVTHPAFLAYKGPTCGEGLVAPSLPENFEDLDEDGKAKAKELLIAQSLYKFYEAFSAEMNLPAYHALRYQETMKGQAVGLAGVIMNDGEVPLQGLLMKIASLWDQLIIKKNVPCPLEYSSEAIEQQKELELKWAEGMARMSDVLEALGGAVRGWEGWVSHEDYEQLKQKLGLCREQFIEYYAGGDKESADAWAKAWPFK